MKKKDKNICRVLNYIDYLLIVTSTTTGFVSISAFTSLVGIPIGIPISAIELKTCAITAEIKKFKSVINKTKKKHDEVTLLAKSKLNSIKVLISKASMLFQILFMMNSF